MYIHRPRSTVGQAVVVFGTQEKIDHHKNRTIPVDRHKSVCTGKVKIVDSEKNSFIDKHQHNGY